MAGEIQALYDALKTRIATATGLSSVVQGMPPINPLVVPSAFLWPARWRHSREADADAWSYGIVSTWMLTAFLEPAAETGEARIEKGIASDDALLTVLEADPGLNDTAFDVVSLEAEVFNGGQQTAQLYAGVQWTIEVALQRPGSGA